MNSLQLPAVEARIAAEAALFTHSIGIKGGQHDTG